MSSHAIQIKALLQSKKLSQTRFNPQSSIRIFQSPEPNIRTLKRSGSARSFAKKPNQQISLIQNRFRRLQQNYRKVLEQTRQKGVLFSKQKSEIQNLKLRSQKDKKQIQRLRAMLGFTKNQDFGVQVDVRIQSKAFFNKDIQKILEYSKEQKSTDIGMCQTDEKWNLKQKRRVTRKQSHAKTSCKLIKNKSQTTISYCSPFKQSKFKGVNQKYKFIPTISLN